MVDNNNKVDVVQNTLGHWGRWQLRTVFLIFLCKIPTVWFMACIIYTAPAPRQGEFFCKPPSNVQNHTAWVRLSHPLKEEPDDQEFQMDFCNVYKDARDQAEYIFHKNISDVGGVDNLFLTTERNSTVIPCERFIHKTEHHSIITQFDLVCTRDILVAVTQFFHLFGVLTGGMLGSLLADYYSPRKIMLGGMLAQIVCGNLTGLVSLFEIHIFFRFLSAVCCAQMYTPGQIILSDVLYGKYKQAVLSLYELFWAVGVIILPGLASFFHSWSHIYMAISLPTFVYVILWYWIPDSPRWQLKRGHISVVRNTLVRAAKVNGKESSIPEDLDDQLNLQATLIQSEPPPLSWINLWRGENGTFFMLVLHITWICFVVCRDGMLLNIRSFGRDHLPINTLVAGLSEAAGLGIGLLILLGTKKKWLWTGVFNIAAGFFGFTGWLFIDYVSGNVQVALLMLTAMVTKASISTGLGMLVACTGELVSADIRKICGFSTIAIARVFLLSAPFIGVLVIFHTILPLTVFSAMGILGGLGMLHLNATEIQLRPKVNNLPPELNVWTVKNHEEFKTRL